MLNALVEILIGTMAFVEWVVCEENCCSWSYLIRQVLDADWFVSASHSSIQLQVEKQMIHVSIQLNENLPIDIGTFHFQNKSANTFPVRIDPIEHLNSTE